MRLTSCIPVLAIVQLSLASITLADGKYFRQSSVLAEPEIPSQRAIITFRNGVQTLVVESTVKGEGESLGWVLPLPAEPVSIKACSAGMVRSISQLVHPNIRGDIFGREWIKSSTIALVASVAFCLVFVLARQHSSAALAFSLAVLVVLVCAGILLPALSKARAGKPMVGIDVVQFDQIGSYDVSVIRGDSGDAIKQWLSANEFAFDDAASTELERYVASKWCFAVAKIRNQASEALAPHPLKVEFPVAQPVYPMRLTGLTHVPLLLDLYVIADQRAATPRLSAWNCDQFTQTKRKNLYDIDMPTYVGTNNGQLIGHPELVSLMWRDCVLTHLRGTLSPQQMGDDFAIDCTIPFRSTQHVVYSHHAALGMSVGVAMLLAAASAIALTVLRRTTDMINGKHVGVAALMLSAIAVFTYLSCDVQAVTSNREVGGRNIIWPNRALSVLGNLDEFAPIDDLEGVLTQEGMMAEGLHFKGWKNDIPSGYALAQVDDGWHVTIYDRHAIPTHVHVNRQGVLTPLP